MTAVLAALLGLAVGLVIGGLGGGGGVLTVPALVYVLGQGAQDATTASVVIVGISALVGVLARLRRRSGVAELDLRRGLLLGLAGLPAAYLGTLLNQHVAPPVLLLSFALLTVVAAVAMLLDARRTRPAAPPEPSAPGGGTTAVAAPPRLLVTAVKVVGSGAAVGFLTGFLGVGGGFLAVPALVLVLRMPMRTAVGTSLLLIVLNSASALVSRLGALHLDWHVVLPFTVAAVVATLLGKRVADRLSGRTLTVAFSLVLIAVGLSVGVESLLAL